MKITVSVIKADIGSVGGHIAPSNKLLETVKKHVQEKGKGFLIDDYVSFTGDDVAILMTHRKGVGNDQVHKLAWDAFVAGTSVAKSQGLYGAGQDLLKDAFSGNVHGMGPAVTEMEFEERPGEPILFFAADKTDPGAYNLPLYLAFGDAMNTPGLMLSPKLAKGFKFVIMDVNNTESDSVIELNAPEDLYDVATLLRDAERFVVESVWSRAAGTQAVSVATSRLHNIAGKYTGKDVLQPFSIGHFVAGCMRGSHNMPIMPVKLNSTISYFDGPPIVSCAAFSIRDGKLTEMIDAFDHPFWDRVRDHVSDKAMDMRKQGFFGAAMLPMNELEYTGIMEKLAVLEKRFTVRERSLAA
jgi:fructose 1,6-bisphosphate aldolase/phosphatase